MRCVNQRLVLVRVWGHALHGVTGRKPVTPSNFKSIFYVIFKKVLRLILVPVGLTSLLFTLSFSKFSKPLRTILKALFCNAHKILSRLSSLSQLLTIGRLSCLVFTSSIGIRGELVLMQLRQFCFISQSGDLALPQLRQFCTSLRNIEEMFMFGNWVCCRISLRNFSLDIGFKIIDARLLGCLRRKRALDIRFKLLQFTIG